MDDKSLTSMIVPFGLLAVLGLVMMFAAVTNREVFFRGGRARVVVRLLGRTGLRVIYGATSLWILGFELWMLLKPQP